MRGRLPVFALAAGVALLSRAAGAAPAPPFEPSGAVLEGRERLPGLGAMPVSLHLGADGQAAASLADPLALAIDWTGTWTFDGTTLDLDLDPVNPMGYPVRITLAVKPSGAAKGTVTRMASETLVTKVSLKQAYPRRKPRGWAAVILRLRDDGGSIAVGDFRGTLVLQDLRPAGGKKLKPLAVDLRALGGDGLPGRTRRVDLLPGQVVRLSGTALPELPVGVADPGRQYEVTGSTAFSPGTVSVTAVEEALRGFSEPATSGTPVPVRWVKALKGKEAAARDAPPLVAPWFRDDGGQGALPRDAVLVLRDLAPFTGDAPLGGVRVSVRTLAGVEVASSTVTLPRADAVEVRPRDLLADAGDLPGGEGQVRLTAADGTPLPRGALGAAIVSTATDAGVPVAALSPTIGSPEPAGRSARLAAPYALAQSGGATTRISVVNLGASLRNLDVLVLALDGTPLYSTFVTVPAGATARVDPEATGMDLALLPGGEGQVVVGGTLGLPVEEFVADGEGRLPGSPDTFFPGPVGFEPPPGAAAVRVLLADFLETGGSDPGDRDASLFLRNGGTVDAPLAARVVDEDGLAVGAPGAEVPVTVHPGESLRIDVESILAALGNPLDPGAGAFRGSLEVSGTLPPGAGPFSALALQLRRSASALGGSVAPVVVR